jgi:hypothetical protein
MTEHLPKTTSSTTPLAQLTPAEARRREIRERARREIPILRRQSKEGIEALRRLTRRMAG